MNRSLAQLVTEAVLTVAGTLWYHGSKVPLDEIKTGRKWKAFDGKTVDAPLWLTEDPHFAKINAGPNGHVYKVEFSPRKTFPEQDLLEMKGNYEEPTHLGKVVLTALEKGEIPLGVPDDVEEILKQMDRLDYDVMETAAVINWAKRKGYDSIWVKGDGPKNLMVLYPEKVKIS